MPVEKITGRHNPLLGKIRKLIRSAAYRRECGVFICEGKKLLQEALLWNAAVSEVLFCGETDLPPLPPETRVFQLPEELLRSVGTFDAPQGLLFTARMPENKPSAGGNRFLILQNIQDPGNVGTVLRSADAFGCAGVFLVGSCADPFQPKTVRASMGAIFRCPLRITTEEELFAFLRAEQVPVWAAALAEGESDIRSELPRRVAFAVGNEGSGLTEAFLSRCERIVKIPMQPRCESLNAATAAALLLWEAYRRSPEADGQIRKEG